MHMNVYIPTLGREDRQLTLESIPEKWVDRVFLACPKSETHKWKNRIDVPEYCIGNISKTRQWIIEQSPTPYVGQLDDDLRFYKRDSVILTKNHRLDNIGEFLDLMENWLLDGEVFTGLSNSFMSHNNPKEYFYGKPSHCSFVNRDYMKNNNIRYDQITYFEDFHVPLSILKSGKRLRYTGEYIAKEFKPNASGGCSINRTKENNRQAMFDLVNKHPNYVTIEEKAGAKNQNLEVGVKLRIAFAKAYKDNVFDGATLENLFD